MAEVLSLCARVAIGGVLLAAGLGKLVERHPPAESALEYVLLPAPVARLYMRLLPWFELGAGLLLLSGLLLPDVVILRQAAFLPAAVLLGTFAGAAAIVRARGQHVECHCFGRLGGGPVTGTTVVRNCLLLGLAMAGWLHPYTGIRAAAHTAEADGAVPAIALGGMALALASMVVQTWLLEAAVRRSRAAGLTDAGQEIVTE